SRTQAASIIVRALDLDTEGAGEAPFKDLANVADETKKEIAAAHEAGIVIGSNNNFMPYQNVTRSQFALMLTRALEYLEIELEQDGIAPFTDIQKLDAETKEAITF